jgi:hypothetical protein
MRICDVRRCAIWVMVLGLCSSCGGPSPTPPAQEGTAPQPGAPQTPPAAEEGADPEDDNVPAPAARSASVLAALLPANGTGCAPNTRCIRVSSSGRPSNTGASIAQCRGEFADFIVPRNTIPANYQGPWFRPNLIEEAHTGVPTTNRPWRAVDPRQESQRLAYLLTLRNYAFASEPVRSLTPQLTADSDYFDPAGRSVPATQRSQKWYPAPRMIYGNPSQPGSREAAQGMTLERTVIVNELGGNTVAFRNYAVAYYDARGARSYARTWDTMTPGRDTPKRAQMRFSGGALVYKLLYSAAAPSAWPQDLLAGSLSVNIIPNANAAPISVRLLQIDIAVKDERAGPTGWYFATYAYDRTVSGNSPWKKMVPVGLMRGNDPTGVPIDESWINPGAPAYATAHLGVDGRLNGPVDNRASACMSCHSTAQAPSVANILPPQSGACAPQRAAWFRNLPGTQAFGRFDPEGSTCETSLSGITLTSADYSLQLGATVTRATPPSAATFNPCTWDDDAPPSATLATAAGADGSPGAPPSVRIFEVSRDPKPPQ